MKRIQLIEEIKKKRSFLCVGLDTDINKIPEHFKDYQDPVFEFNKAIIDATKDLAVAYKANIAFYECLGPKGWESLQKTEQYIPDNCFTIADAKRGDIGNTSGYYAKTFFEYMDFDAITVAPYMGHDSVLPFLEYADKWVILLALTSNEGALDYQFLRLEADKKRLFEKVIIRSTEWGNINNLMYVVGATRGDLIEDVRKIIPEHFLLLPGIGAQGGKMNDVNSYALTQDCGALVNASRSILYAGQGENFHIAARNRAVEIQQLMEPAILQKMS